jgi:hypothetical protein
MTKGQDWKAMLAELVTNVQAQTKVPAPEPLRDAFGKQGYTIPVLILNPDDRSGSVTTEDLENLFDAFKDKEKA